MLSRDSHTQGNSNRSLVLKFRLGYARRGIPTSLADVERKKPKFVGWQDKATTDPRQIHMECNRWPDAGVLMPTGKRSRGWVLDVDSLDDLVRLEKALGIRLLGITTQVKTQSGNLQLHFLWPEDEGPEIRNSTGKNVLDGYEKLDVRGEGGLALLPPSVGYEFANDLPSIEAPVELVEWARNRKGSSRRSRRSERTGDAPRKVDLPDDGPIHDGGRHDELARIAGRLHDGTRSLDQITQELLEINASRCVPPIGSPGDDPLDDVVRIARWIYSKEPCRSSREQDPEVDGVLQRISDDWYRRFLRGGGRSKLRDVRRAILESAAKRRELRTVIVDGVELRGVMFSDSSRQIAEAVKTSAMSAWRHMRKLEKAGEIVKIEARDGLAPTWLLIDTAQKCYTPNYSPSLKREREVEGGVTLTRADELETPMRGWLHPVGNAGSGIEAALEGYGPMSSEELAEALGYARVRDLERRHLRRLVKLGVIEHRGGKWVRSKDHALHDRLLDEPFATVHRRRVRRRTSEGRIVVEVAETVKVASERERCQERREKHVDQRRDWRARRILRERVRDDVENATFEELPPATTEMLAANRVGRYLLARGWKRFDKRLWVDPAGEIMPVDRAIEEAA